MPSFLTPWMLYGLAAISVPVVIHLWQRRRVVQIPFSTLRFLKIVAARTSRTSKIENLLLLLLRCALFALVITAAARPIVMAKTARFLGGDVPRTLILIIDNSASMGWRNGDRTRLDTAKENALALFDDLKQGDRIAVIAASDRAEMLVPEPTIDRAVARKAVESIRQEQTRGDLAAALLEARKIAARAERGVRHAFVFTDSQAGAWQPILGKPESLFDETWKAADLRLVIVRPDDLTANNATVKKVAISNPFLVPGAVIHGVATVQNFSTAPLHDLMEIVINGQRTAQVQADAPPGGVADINFEFPAPASPGRWAKGIAKLSGDRLTADDAFYFTLPVYQKPHILLVEGQQIGPDRLHASFYLRKALSARFGSEQPGGMASPEFVDSRDCLPAQRLDETPCDTYSAVFLCDPGRLGDRSLVRLNRFLDGGGTVVVFPGDQTSLGDLAKMDFLPGKPTAQRTLAEGRQPAKILDPGHPLFANAWDSNTPFPALPQQKMLDWKLAPEARVLVSLGAAGKGDIPATGLPFLIAGERGAGRVLIVNASADRTWGDLPLSPAFLPLVQQIARLSATQLGGRPGFSIGEPVPLPPGLPPDQPFRLIHPDNTAREMRPDRQNRRLLERPDQVGIYEVHTGGGDSPASLMFAVNIDRAESNLAPIDESSLEKLAQNHLRIDSVTGRDALKQWISKSRGVVPLWPLLLGLALAVFAAEGILSNLMARRRAQGDEQHIKTGRLNRRRMGVPFHAAAEGRTSS